MPDRGEDRAKPRRAERIESDAHGPEMLFYDGQCGVCHWAVDFVARRDEDGTAFRFAPLHGPTFVARVPSDVAAELPDSMVVLTREGRVLPRSTALVHVLQRLGRPWPWIGRILAWVPRPLRDFGYDRFARIRHRLAPRPEGTCPIVPAELRHRFDP